MQLKKDELSLELEQSSKEKVLMAQNNDKRKREDLKLYYHLLTPKDVYVKYKSFSIEPDNSIHSKVDLQCIKPNGKKEDCGCHYDNLKQRLEFESGLMEIDLDANGKIVFI